MAAAIRADRAEEPLLQASDSACPDNKQIGTSGRFDQHGTGFPVGRLPRERRRRPLPTTNGDNASAA
jgi:hypothetical protein